MGHSYRKDNSLTSDIFSRCGPSSGEVCTGTDQIFPEKVKIYRVLYTPPQKAAYISKKCQKANYSASFMSDPNKLWSIKFRILHWAHFSYPKQNFVTYFLVLITVFPLSSPSAHSDMLFLSLNNPLFSSSVHILKALDRAAGPVQRFRGLHVLHFAPPPKKRGGGRRLKVLNGLAVFIIFPLSLPSDHSEIC